MSSTIEFVQSVCRQTAAAGEMTYKKMFGEYGVYCGGKFIGLICDNRFFIKVTPEGEKAFPHAPKTPPYPGAKPCFLIDTPSSADALRLLRLTADALPHPADKPAKRPVRKTKKPRPHAP